MEFKEFSNPLENNYDINSSLNSNTQTNNYYSDELVSLIGILEDITEADLEEQYGISMSEYLNPTAETIEKVTERLNSFEKGRHI